MKHRYLTVAALLLLCGCSSNSNSDSSFWGWVSGKPSVPPPPNSVPVALRPTAEKTTWPNLASVPSRPADTSSPAIRDAEAKRLSADQAEGKRLFDAAKTGQ